VKEHKHMLQLLRKLLWPLALLNIIALLVFAYVAIRKYSAPPQIEAISPSASSAKSDAEITPSGPPAPAALAAQIKSLGSNFDGDVGISVRSIENGWAANFNAERPFPQQSVSKLWVAATVMDKVDTGALRLSDTITLTPADLTIFHQPIRQRMGNGAYTADLSELLTFAMTQSDNTANDALFRKVGGKAGVEAFLVRKRLSGISMSKGEKALQMSIAGMEWDDRFSYGQIFWQMREAVPFATRARAITAYAENPADGAAPVSITAGLARLQKGELLSRASTAYLLDLMNQSKTGPKRLRGGLSGGWQMAHKTGTGQVLKLLATAYNDVGILTSPSGQHYAVAVMIGSTNRPVTERMDLMQAVTRAVIACEAVSTLSAISANKFP
jgi:beta-lactamase class A